MMTCTPMTDAELTRLGTRDDAGFGALETARGHLPMTAMTVEARVIGLVAETELAQTFENTLTEPIEATYIFPLPDRAAVTRFCMEVAGRVIDGVIEERGQARQQYEEAIAAGHRAAITEEDRAGVFTLRVGNLMPGEVAVVRLTLVGPLPVDQGEVTFRFPLVVAPRYIPGGSLPGPRAGTGVAPDTDAVPDASRITPPVLLPGCPNPVRLAIAVTVDGGGVPVGDLRSSLHAVTDSVRSEIRKVELRPGERLDRDFILRWSIGDAEVRSGAIAVPDRDGEGATVMVTMVPPRGDAAAVRPRDVVFVLDRSGSMGGWKMVAARRAVARMVDTLGESDRFAVFAFDDRIDTPPQLPAASLVAASDRHRFRAVEFLAAIDARGGTELRAPLVRGVDLLAGGYDDRDRILVLVTDGQVGNEDQILRELAQRVKNVRVFTLGVDQAVNAAFLRRLAAAGGGACELVESEDRLDAVMAKVHRRIATPVVTELAIRGDGLALDHGSLAPHRIPALFTGAPVLVAARLRGRPGAGGTIVVTGKTPSGQPWSQTIPVVVEPHGDAAAAMWARARIRDLEDQYAIQSSGKPELEREIVAVSLRHRVLSRFTAFLAVDRSETVNPRGNPRTVTQAVEQPAGWQGSGRFAPAPPMAPPMAAYPGAAPPPPAGGSFAAPAAAPGAPPSRGGGGLLGKAKAMFSRDRAADRKEARMQPASEAAAPPPQPAPLGRPTTMKTAAYMVDAFSEEEAPAPIGTDVEPYRRRARDLADAIDRAADHGDRRALDLALARLAELVEDVRSVGGLDALASALDAVAVALGQHVADAGSRTDDWRRVAADLRKLGDEAGTPAPTPAPPGGGRAFWK
jgi:Ca-activated chloride channel homolog